MFFSRNYLVVIYIQRKMPRRPLKKVARQLQKQKQYQRLVNIINVMSAKAPKRKRAPQGATKEKLLSPDELAQKAAIARYERNLYFTKLNDTSRQDALAKEVMRLQNQLQNQAAAVPVVVPAAAPPIPRPLIIPGPARVVAPPPIPVAPPMAPIIPPGPLRIFPRPPPLHMWPMVPAAAAASPLPQMPRLAPGLSPDMWADFMMPSATYPIMPAPTRRRSAAPITFPKLEEVHDDDSTTALEPMDVPLPPPAPASSGASSSSEYPGDDEPAPAQDVLQITQQQMPIGEKPKRLSRRQGTLTRADEAEFLNVLKHIHKDANVGLAETLELAGLMGVNFTEDDYAALDKAGTSYTKVAKFFTRADNGKFVKKILEVRRRIQSDPKLGPRAAGIRGIMAEIKRDLGLADAPARGPGRPIASKASPKPSAGVIPPPPRLTSPPAGVAKSAKRILGQAGDAIKGTFGALRGSGLSADEGLTDSALDAIIRNISSGSALRRAYQGIIEPEDLHKIKISRSTPSAFVIFEKFPGEQHEGHWTSLWIDPKHSIEYFNSFGDEPNTQLQKGFGSLIKRNRLGGVHGPIKLKVNGLRRQSVNSSNCGFFAADFLDKRAKVTGDGAFAEASGFNGLLRKIQAAGMNLTGDSERAIEIQKRKFGDIGI